MFPDQSYGRPYPTAKELDGLKLAEVQKFFNENFSASRAHLYVVGKFDPGIKDAIRQSFKGWKQGQADALPAAKPVSRYSLQQIDRPGAAQSTVYLGIPVAGPRSRDYLTLEVMDALLGGSFASRITENIRENKGYTYSPRSFVAQAGHDSYWTEVADVTTAVTGPSLHEIFSEVKRLRQEPPPANELKDIQSYLAGLFVLRNTISPDAVISQLHFVDSQELNRSFLFTYVQKVDAVTPSDIQRVTETYIAPSKMTVVVVGDQSKVADQLKAFATAP
jgi:predicted Zn-dependent peptidase